jgi:uncharacterized protein YegP (UPF0339 family)
MTKFQVYTDRSGGLRWRLVDGNHRIIADSAEAYVTRQGVMKAIENVFGDLHKESEPVIDSETEEK